MSLIHVSTRSSAVAERPRDASCLSVVGFSSLLLLVRPTSAPDLQMRTINFCSVVFGVTYRLSAIN